MINNNIKMIHKLSLTVNLVVKKLSLILNRVTKISNI